MEKLSYTLVRSRRKTLALQVKPDGTLLLRAPLRCPNAAIASFLALHEGWAREKQAEALARRAARPVPTAEERAALFARASSEIPPIAARYARLMGVEPSGIKITGAEHRFGSCSGKNSLCFSYRLVTYPPEAVEYVVVHELAHIREKNHSKDFYAVVAAVLPDYKQREKLLRQ